MKNANNWNVPETLQEAIEMYGEEMILDLVLRENKERYAFWNTPKTTPRTPSFEKLTEWEKLFES